MKIGVISVLYLMFLVGFPLFVRNYLFHYLFHIPQILTLPDFVQSPYFTLFFTASTSLYSHYNKIRMHQHKSPIITKHSQKILDNPL